MKGLSIATIISAGLALAACQNADDTSAGDTAPVAGPIEPAPPPVAATPAAPVEPQSTEFSRDYTWMKSADGASPQNQSDWTVLFAGNDVTNFEPLGVAQWNITNDYVGYGEARGFLVTKESYGDFHLRAQFWAGPGTNSGIFVRCDDPAAVGASSCYEINISDTNQNPDNRTGSIVNFQPPLITVESEGQWNDYDIVVEGSHIVVTLNGTVTADYVDPDNTHPSGPFALQTNGGLIRFRNVRVRPL